MRTPARVAVALPSVRIACRVRPTPLAAPPIQVGLRQRQGATHTPPAHAPGPARAVGRPLAPPAPSLWHATRARCWWFVLMCRAAGPAGLVVPCHSFVGSLMAAARMGSLRAFFIALRRTAPAQNGACVRVPGSPLFVWVRIRYARACIGLTAEPEKARVQMCGGTRRTRPADHCAVRDTWRICGPTKFGPPSRRRQ